MPDQSVPYLITGLSNLNGAVRSQNYAHNSIPSATQNTSSTADNNTLGGEVHEKIGFLPPAHSICSHSSVGNGVQQHVTVAA